MAISMGDGSYFRPDVEAGGFPAIAQASGMRAIAGDFNGDGRSDIALSAGAGGSGIPVAWFRNGIFAFTNQFVPNFPGWSRSGHAKSSADPW